MGFEFFGDRPMEEEEVAVALLEGVIGRSGTTPT
jgi:hypothetical protein